MTICGVGNKDSYKTKEEMRKDYGVKRYACIWDHNVSDKETAVWPPGMQLS